MFAPSSERSKPGRPTAAAVQCYRSRRIRVSFWCDVGVQLQRTSQQASTVNGLSQAAPHHAVRAASRCRHQLKAPLRDRRQITARLFPAGAFLPAPYSSRAEPYGLSMAAAKQTQTIADRLYSVAVFLTLSTWLFGLIAGRLVAGKGLVPERRRRQRRHRLSYTHLCHTVALPLPPLSSSRSMVDSGPGAAATSTHPRALFGGSQGALFGGPGCCTQRQKRRPGHLADCLSLFMHQPPQPSLPPPL